LFGSADVLKHHPPCGLPYDCVMAVVSKSVFARENVGMIGRFFFGVYSVRRRIAIAAAGVLALGLGYHVVFGNNGLFVYEQKRSDAQTLDGELHTLSDENDRLKGHVDRLQSDPNAIEHEARNVLHYTRPGEVVVMLPESPSKK
jgi:cell division protein FtsB